MILHLQPGLLQNSAIVMLSKYPEVFVKNLDVLLVEIIKKLSRHYPCKFGQCLNKSQQGKACINCCRARNQDYKFGIFENQCMNYNALDNLYVLNLEK